MNPIYIQLGIAVWLELARRRAEEKKESNTAHAIQELMDSKGEITENMQIKIPGVAQNVAECLADIVESVLKAVKP